MPSITKRALILSAVASLSVAGIAQAATDATNAQLDGGTASMVAPTFSDFTNTTITGSAQSKSTAVTDWSVNDARGSGAGWEVTMSASPLQTAGAVVMTGATLTVSAATVSPTDVGNTSTAPVVAGGDVLAGTVTVADAAANAGLGAWSLAQGADDLTIGIPADARAGAYSSTITTTLTPGI